LLASIGCKSTISGDMMLEEQPPQGGAKVAVGPEILLHCIGLQPLRRGACEQGSPIVTALVKAAQTHTFWHEVLEDAQVLQVGDLSMQERLITQNALLYMASFDWDGKLDAIRLLWILALEPEKIEAMGDQPTPEIGLWLDSPKDWIDRKAKSSPLEHETTLRYTQFFRPVLAGGVRAIVGQLVAVDKRWRPHITPMIGTLEALQDAGPKTKDPGACVALLDVEARRCGAAAGLEALMLLNPAPKAFASFLPVGTEPHRVRCASCHETAPPNDMVEDLPESSRAQYLKERKQAFLTEVAARVGVMKELARQAREHDVLE
jgi:hypothetical protein